MAFFAALCPNLPTTSSHLRSKVPTPLPLPLSFYMYIFITICLLYLNPFSFIMGLEGKSKENTNWGFLWLAWWVFYSRVTNIAFSIEIKIWDTHSFRVCQQLKGKIIQIHTLRQILNNSEWLCISNLSYLAPIGQGPSETNLNLLLQSLLGNPI